MSRVRTANLKRITRETSIKVDLDLDGSGKGKICSGIRFLDHMLESLAKHGLFDLTLTAKGDLDVDLHHTNEDIGIVLGKAFCAALGDKCGIRRFADMRAPLDEALTQVRVSLDLSGRGGLYLHTHPKTRWIEGPAGRVRGLKQGYSLGEAKHLLDAFASNIAASIHVDLLSGEDAHHVLESTFKALALALRAAVDIDPRRVGIPSTKGRL
ncbi:MAG: imidazoleglycerol-phosphate dehydratase HisB [Candidatus Omnitrophota bacterium]